VLVPRVAFFEVRDGKGSPNHGFSANIASNSIPLISKFTFAETLYAKLVIAVADSAWPRRQIGVVLQENILMNHLGTSRWRVRACRSTASSRLPSSPATTSSSLAT
jgi:hypothetical protein